MQKRIIMSLLPKLSFRSNRNLDSKITVQDLLSNKFKLESYILGAHNGILFFPDWSYYNAYQRLFYTTLNNLYGYTALGMDYTNFTEECLTEYSSKCNILHIHWLHYFYKINDEKSIDSFFAKLKLAKALGYTIIWTVHNLVSHDTANFEKEIIISKRLSSLVDHIIVHGVYAKDEIISEFNADKRKIHVIPCGHYRGYYLDKIGKNKARKILDIPANDFVFLFFGNIKEYKGLSFLVDAFIALNRKYPDSTLLIAGRGLDSQIQEYVESNVKSCKKIIAHIEFIPNDNVQLYFNSSDLVVLPYKNILTSSAALLALSFLKPVIAPSIGLIPDVVSEGTGFLFSGYKEMESIMEKCLQDRRIIKFSEKNFKRKLSELDWKVLLKDSFFSKLIN